MNVKVIVVLHNLIGYVINLTGVPKALRKGIARV